MSALFESFGLRALTLRNRIGVSPMCQYSSRDGYASDWHLVHLGAFATGGAGLVFTEASAVLPEGRISPQDLGIWDDRHVAELRKITSFVRAQGAAIGIQLAHAGRKASMRPPWMTSQKVPTSEGGWENVVAPSAVAFSDAYAQPEALDEEGIARVVSAFVLATQRALAADFQVVELHAAHGYLLHEFLSPLSNRRTDAYGGCFENRVRLLLDVARAVREAWPDDRPLVVRISATDWVEGGWDIEQSIRVSALLREVGVDLIDCSTGGVVPGIRIPVEPNYQVPFARRIRQEAGIPTAAVGLITEPHQAERIVRDGDADMVLMARELLRNPRWPLLAAHELGARVDWPDQYARAKPRD